MGYRQRREVRRNRHLHRRASRVTQVPRSPRLAAQELDLSEQAAVRRPRKVALQA